jgi:hypothetical protein
MSTPNHIQMKKIELGGAVRASSHRIPIIHEDDVSQRPREHSPKKKLFSFKFKYEIQVNTGENKWETKEGEKEILVKCDTAVPNEQVNTIALNKLQESFMINDRFIQGELMAKRRIF